MFIYESHLIDIILSNFTYTIKTKIELFNQGVIIIKNIKICIKLI